jgi:hypothetical protein
MTISTCWKQGDQQHLQILYSKSINKLTIASALGYEINLENNYQNCGITYQITVCTISVAFSVTSNLVSLPSWHWGPRQLLNVLYMRNGVADVENIRIKRINNPVNQFAVDFHLQLQNKQGTQISTFGTTWWGRKNKTSFQTLRGRIYEASSFYPKI